MGRGASDRRDVVRPRSEISRCCILVLFEEVVLNVCNFYLWEILKTKSVQLKLTVEDLENKIWRVISKITANKVVTTVTKLSLEMLDVFGGK